MHHITLPDLSVHCSFGILRRDTDLLYNQSLKNGVCDIACMKIFSPLKKLKLNMDVQKKSTCIILTDALMYIRFILQMRFFHQIPLRSRSPGAAARQTSFDR